MTNTKYSSTQKERKEFSPTKKLKTKPETTGVKKHSPKPKNSELKQTYSPSTKMQFTKKNPCNIKMKYTG